MDLLLGWSLDPQLPDAMRSAPCLALSIRWPGYVKQWCDCTYLAESQWSKVERVFRYSNEEKVWLMHMQVYMLPLIMMSCRFCGRPQMAATFLSLHVVWAEETAFAVQLVRNLVKDMAAISVGPCQATVAQLRRFLALCNCVAAFAKACGGSLAAHIAGVCGTETSTIDRCARCPECSDASSNSCSVHGLHSIRDCAVSDP